MDPQRLARLEKRHRCAAMKHAGVFVGAPPDVVFASRRPRCAWLYHNISTFATRPFQYAQAHVLHRSAVVGRACNMRRPPPSNSRVARTLSRFALKHTAFRTQCVLRRSTSGASPPSTTSSPTPSPPQTERAPQPLHQAMQKPAGPRSLPLSHNPLTKKEARNNSGLFKWWMRACLLRQKQECEGLNDIRGNTWST